MFFFSLFWWIRIKQQALRMQTLPQIHVKCSTVQCRFGISVQSCAVMSGALRVARAGEFSSTGVSIDHQTSTDLLSWCDMIENLICSRWNNVNAYFIDETPCAMNALLVLCALMGCWRCALSNRYCPDLMTDSCHCTSDRSKGFNRQTVRVKVVCDDADLVETMQPSSLPNSTASLWVTSSCCECVFRVYLTVPLRTCTVLWFYYSKSLVILLVW